MERKYWKGLAGVLCLALLICCLGLCPVPAMARTNKGAGNLKTTYALSELKEAGNWYTTVKKEGAVVSLSYTGAWQMIFYEIPEEIRAAGFNGCQVKFKGNAQDYTLKLVGEAGAFKGIARKDRSDKVSVMDLDDGATAADVADIRNIAITNLKDGANTLVVESVTFLFPQELEEKDVVSLKDAMTSVMGSDFIVGTTIDGGNLGDEQLMQLVTKHFNGVTLENTLKPQFILNCYADKYPQGQLQTVTINGKSLSVPKLDYSSAEKTLDYIYNWNQKHPNDKIRVRGHVLVWHSQTPEWFFHKDYDVAKPYVDAATMSLREEWYIKSVAEHFTGAGSKYKDMFYGWDVVNEAVSDWPGGYRKDTGEATANSSWWAVYKSNKYITDAFVFANKYFPASVELYYNDYGDSSQGKSKDILTLLKDVKNTQGARIDGFGMQAHYSTKSNEPSGEDFKRAVRAYCEVVDHVQITELDFAATDAYDGTSKTQAAEDERTAARYKEIYDAVKSLKAEGKKVTGFTVWGVIDKNSWLNGSKPQCPLLFDNNYHAKKSFYVLVDGWKAPEKTSDTQDDTGKKDDTEKTDDTGNKTPAPGSGDVTAIKPKVSTLTLKKGESAFFELADGAEKAGIKSITYKAGGSVVSVNRKGKITAKKKGTATVKAVVKLENGDKKTVKMKVKVKK